MTFVEVSVATTFTGRRFYTYESDKTIMVGSIVQVPFGKKSCLAIVRRIVKKPTFATKKIALATPLTLSAESLALLGWLESFYPYDFGDTTSLFIPPNVLTRSREPKPESPEMIQSFLAALPPLTTDQAAALELIRRHPHVLLHGDTGTGKTRVFLEYANTVLAQGKNVVIVTPEIGLTPQLEQSIKAMCNYPVYVIHSQKTPAHRKRIWQVAAQNERPALYIGPRSSLFLPYRNLGLVVADEAHDNSYKNMQNPRYNGLYVAAQLAKIHHAHFVQSTATPNVSDYTYAATKHVPVARMTTIAAGSKEVEGVVIDMTDTTQFSTHKHIGTSLIKAIEGALKNSEQAMLFINRRGSARVVQCNSCGYIEACERCGLPLTFHHDTHILSCHVCGNNIQATSQCHSCGSVDLLYFSPGTKGLEQEIAGLFPGARSARFDLDVAAKDTIHRKLAELQAGQYDIIIGTQLISKGFDLPRLSVVGVLNADTGFSIPDFRAEEITFQQIYQVTGRVGRGHKLSKYFIQTRQPHHPVIEAALARNWQVFYSYELHKRKLFTYPPFHHLAVLGITKKRSATAEATAKKLAAELAKHTAISVLGPTPGYHETAHGGHTWQLLVKSASRLELVRALEQLPSEWTIDIDPTSVL